MTPSGRADAAFPPSPAIGRRQVLRGAASLSLLALLTAARSPDEAAADGLRFGPPRTFDFERLKRRARRLAEAPHRSAPVRAERTLETIDYDAYQQIRFRSEHALWRGEPPRRPVQFFHPGRFFKAPVAIHVVKGGEAREVLFSRDLFRYGDTGLDTRLTDELGFAGFRVMDPDNETDWLSFLGAAYFRSSGALDQYGLSARGVAIDTGLSTPEEFPRFTAFWLEAPPQDPAAILVHALLDGPSLTGAFRMRAAKDGAVVMDVEASLYTRKAVGRLGLAPLTSMFWFSETNRHQATDWRPEIHDSDGLAMWTGTGERIWRPLNNPRRVQTSSFLDTDPRGFGLLQRDRAFDHYQDDGVFYDRRPSVWVEPAAGWGKGAVQLVEIPTDDEIHDNIVAYWVPDAPVTADSEISLGYRLHWVAEEPYPPALGRCVATRVGRGGVPGQDRPKGVDKVVVDFEGGPLDGLDSTDPVELVVTPSGGRIAGFYVLRVVGTRRWRAVFDIAGAGDETVDVRAFLRLGDRPLTETWLWQYHPVDWE